MLYAPNIEKTTFAFAKWLEYLAELRRAKPNGQIEIKPDNDQSSIKISSLSFRTAI